MTTSTMGRWCAAFVLALAIGCGRPGSTPETSVAPPPGDSSVASGTAGAPPTTPAPPGAGAQLEVDGLTMQRVGRDVVELRLTLVNGNESPAAVGARLSNSPAEAGSVSGVLLADPGGSKRYFVLRDQKNRPVCSSGLATLVPGERVEVWSRFPVPSEPRVEVWAPGGRRLGTVEVPPVPEGTAGR